MKQRSKVMGDEPPGMYYSKRSDDDEEVPMQRVRPYENCIEAQVQDGDTLQALALRFHCTISELKRINHMHKDNEIFARRTLKVPVTPYSVLTQVLPAPSPPPEPSTSNGTLDKPSEGPADHIIDYNAAILNSTIAPAVVPYTDADSPEQAEENTLLIQPPKKESVEAVVVKELTSHGADFGIKWFHLLLLILTLGVAAPIIYIKFFVHVHTEAHAMPASPHPPH